MITTLDKVIYTAKTHTTGGRDGKSVSSDKLLEINMTPPKEMGGSGGATNPEQLFAAGYSACFIGAIKFVAEQKKITVSNNVAIDAQVDIGPIPQGFGIAVRLIVDLPGLDKSISKQLVDAAHQVCPYSNATRGNITVDISIK